MAVIRTPDRRLRAFVSSSIGELADERRAVSRAVSGPPRDAQLEAFARWGIPDPSQLARLAAITHPTFVAGGDNDTMMITENSSLLAHQLPNAQLRMYPDSGHGFLDQYPERFADHVRAFLNGG